MYFATQRLEENHEKDKHTIVNLIASLILEARSLCYVGMAVKKSKVTGDNPWSDSHVTTKWVCQRWYGVQQKKLGIGLEDPCG